MRPPFRPALLNGYCRLFPPTDQPFDLEKMRQLGRSTARKASRIPPTQPMGNLAAGYTYFGQFIDHDLTRDETPLSRATHHPSSQERAVNFADACLNLHPLYGAGPESEQDAHLYAEDGASFRLGTVRSLLTGEPFDLPIASDGPQSAETRNAENIILRQLCGVFLKLHNAAVRELPSSMPPRERFERARGRVCWQYQWLVREDYLARIINRRVYQEVIREGHCQIDWQRHGFSIPLEFAQAAFRFGHSLVRANYDLNRFAQSVPLRRIFAGPHLRGPLEERQTIDWRSLLDPEKNPAMAIDTAVVLPLFRLPPTRSHHLTTAEARSLPPELPVRTLQRGAAARLATGETVALALGCENLREKSFSWSENPWGDLDALGLTGRTPLWYYILLEAELEETGRRLGPVGSHIVAETIEGALRSDPASYLSCNGPSWRPPSWKTPAGAELAVNRLADVAVVIGLSQPASST